MNTVRLLKECADFWKSLVWGEKSFVNSIDLHLLRADASC